MFFERRKSRSSKLDQALNLWLCSAAHRSGAAGFVLADDEGLLMASDVELDGIEDVAAMAPSLGRDELFNEAPIAVSPIDLGEETYWLCALGSRGKRDYGLRIAEDGVRRILNR